MKTRKELDRAAELFAACHGDTLGKPIGVHDGNLLYQFLPAGCVRGGCIGVQQFIVVEVSTGVARYQTNNELMNVNIASVLDHLDPIPDLCFSAQAPASVGGG